MLKAASALGDITEINVPKYIRYDNKMLIWIKTAVKYELLPNEIDVIATKMIISIQRKNRPASGYKSDIQ